LVQAGGRIGSASGVSALSPDPLSRIAALHPENRP
jgi:hypothetical protein